MANYLITGAAGFIGSSLAQKFIDNGHKVMTIDNLSTGFKSNIPKGVSFIEGDCSSSKVINKLPDDTFDAIFHIAGQSSGEISFDDPVYDIKTNTESTLLLLKFALKNGCRRFIYAGTMSVYGIQGDYAVDENANCKPQSFYGVGKLASEHYLRIYEQYGIQSTSLRLFNVYGPGQNLSNLRQGMVSIFLAQMFSNSHIHVKGSQDRYRDFIHIDDVVEAFQRCLVCQDSKGEIINIATGVRTSIKELINILISNQKNKITVEYSGKTSGDINGIYADISKMKFILGMNQLVSIDQGLSRLVNWAKNMYIK
jgi:UDP-glucose 4-epimerase